MIVCLYEAGIGIAQHATYAASCIEHDVVEWCVSPARYPVRAVWIELHSGIVHHWLLLRRRHIFGTLIMEIVAAILLLVL